MLDTYTVILAYPDYILGGNIETYTFTAYGTPQDVVRAAQLSALATTNPEPNDDDDDIDGVAYDPADDFAVIAIIRGEPEFVQEPTQ